MPAPLTGLLPENLWFPEKRVDAIKFLADQPAPANVRRDWLVLWALWVGLRLDNSDYRKVQEGSVDA
jgi:hypothetical protein